MAGKSFSDMVRNSARHHKADDILERIRKIKSNSNPDFDFNHYPVEQPNKQAIEQADNRATEQPNKQTTEQADNRTTEQATKYLSEHLSEHLSEQSNNRAIEQTNKQTIEQPTEQADNRAIEQTTEQVNNRTTEQIPNFFLFKKPVDLKLNQFQVLYYIYFCRPFKVSGSEGLSGVLNIKYGTVRNCLNSLVQKGYINKPFSINDGVNNGSSCVVNEIKCLKIFGQTPIEQPSKQATEQTITQADNWTSGQLSKQTNRQTTEQANFSNKLVSKYLNKLTYLLENSLLWKAQSLSIKKCEEWIKEFYPDDPDSLITQLMFAEKTPAVLNPKSKTPTDVFYGCLVKGGLTRPKDFEFPEERQVRIKKQEIEAQEKRLAEIEAIRQKEKELADKLAFNELLNDKESVDFLINQIEKRFVTAATKISIKLFREKGKIDSKLERALERELNMSDSE